MIYSLVCDLCKAIKTTTDERFVNAPHAGCDGGTWRDEYLPPLQPRRKLTFEERTELAKHQARVPYAFSRFDTVEEWLNDEGIPEYAD